MTVMTARRWLLPGLMLGIACAPPPTPAAVPEDRKSAAPPEAIAAAPAEAEVEPAPAEAAETAAAPAEEVEAAATPEPAPAPAVDPLAAFAAATPRCPEGVKHCVGVVVHVARSGEGEALVQDAAWFTEQLLAADQRFAAIDVGFEVAEVRALPASEAAIVSRQDRDLLGRPRFGRGPVHVFVVGSLADVDTAGEFIRGVHWRDRADRERRWVILSAIAGSLVLTHELGHFFGLPHSSYPGSVMNKQDLSGTPFAERGFHAREIAKMRRGRDAMLAAGMLAPRRRPAAAAKPAKPGP